MATNGCCMGEYISTYIRIGTYLEVYGPMVFPCRVSKSHFQDIETQVGAICVCLKQESASVMCGLHNNNRLYTCGIK